MYDWRSVARFVVCLFYAGASLYTIKILTSPSVAPSTQIETVPTSCTQMHAHLYRNTIRRSLPFCVRQNVVRRRCRCETSASPIHVDIAIASGNKCDIVSRSSDGVGVTVPCYYCVLVLATTPHSFTQAGGVQKRKTGWHFFN